MSIGLDPVLDDKIIRREGYLTRMALSRLHPDDASNRNNISRKRYGIWNRPKISNANAIRHEVTPQEVGRLDRIADTYLGDSRYWWVIAELNGIKNQLEEMAAGQILLVPSLADVQSAITEGEEALFD